MTCSMREMLCQDVQFALRVMGSNQRTASALLLEMYYFFMGVF